MRYLADVKEGEQVVDIYLCADKQILKTRAGKTYYSIRLQDKSGTGDAKIWDLNDGINNFEKGDYIKVDASVVSFQGGNQLNIRRLRVAQEGEYDPKEYVPTSVYDIDKMYRELLAFVDEIDDKWLKELAGKFFIEDSKFKNAFKGHTAAKSVHHAFYGGLLEHTLAMLRICRFMANAYPSLNKSLLYIGALLHDAGKIKELSNFPIVEYTDEGQLVGHIIIGVEWVSEKAREIKGFPETLLNLVKHMIIAHHGELEYGSPKKPGLIEAIVLHYIDNMDAKIMTFTTILNDSNDEDDWAGYQRLFDGNIRKTRY